MPDASGDALARARTILQERLSELDAERRQIERALAELGGGKALAELGGGKAGRRGPGRPRGSRNRRRGSTRADQAASAVTDSPGISASEIAKKLEIAPNYMYRVMSELVKEGRVRKSGRGYHPNGGPSGAAADQPAPEAHSGSNWFAADQQVPEARSDPGGSSA